MTHTSTIPRSVEIGLRLVGLWPRSSYQILKRVIWTILSMIVLVLQYWYFIVHIKSDDMPEMMDSLSLIVSNTLLFGKLIIIWNNDRKLHGILTTMAENWSTDASSDYKMKILSKKAALSSLFTDILTGMYTLTICLYSLSVLVRSNNNTDEVSASQGRRWIIKMELFWGAKFTPIYECIIIVQFIVESLAICIVMTMMALIATSVLHVGSQIEIMCHELSEVFECYKRNGSSMSILKTIIVRHQRIIRLSEDIECVFSKMSMLQLLFNSISLCFLGFIIVTSFSGAQGYAILLKCLPHYIAINMEAFILCFTGEYLSSKSAAITKAAYDSFWYNLNPRESRVILLIILRSQKRLTITAGKFVNISLDTFAYMVRSSVSYISVLHAMY